MEKRRKILVTAALPYANGEIHLGHLFEYLQTDIWARFQKLRGHECWYFCADDTHGTPIMIAANKRGISPETLIEQAKASHLRDFTKFQVQFDHYGSTNSPENKEFSSLIFKAMESQGHIAKKSIRQAYCENDKMFLPDRFVRGECPKCGAQDQYGDSCDHCSSTYAPTDLKNPKCSVCGAVPVQKDSEHLFFKLSNFQEFLQKWVREHTQPEIANKLQEWLKDTLRDWDISRDAPYFGFEIPGHPGKYFYVWLDAPVGYISASAQWCKANQRDLDEIWKNPDCEIYHFIGKDIVYFHTLFWPAMLQAAGFSLPTKVFAHGFLKVNGEKMSKSKGTFINAETFAKHVDPTYLRYYFACKMTAGVDDVDLSFKDFVNRVNSDLVGKITNLASRGFQMLHKSLDGKLGILSDEGRVLVEQAQQRAETIAGFYESRLYSKALIEIREIADEANRYFDEQEPWKLVKTDPEQTRAVITTVINLFRIISVYLKPVLPLYVQTVESLFQEKPFQWASLQEIIENRPVEKYVHLLKRLEMKDVEKIVEDSRPKESEAPKPSEDNYIDIDTFLKTDLRAAKVVKAESVEGADKLLKLTLDVGDSTRTVFAGIKKYYEPEQVEGRMVILVANLKPRQMKFGLSEGMVLCASDKEGVRLLSPDAEVLPGSKVS